MNIDKQKFETETQSTTEHEKIPKKSNNPIKMEYRHKKRTFNRGV